MNSNKNLFLSILIILQLLFCVLPNGAIVFAEEELVILSFEETNPVASITYLTDEMVGTSDFPDKLTAVVSCTPEKFEQVKPKNTGIYIAPENAESLYEKENIVVYSFIGASDVEYRVYGSADGVESWFACDSAGMINGRIQSVPINWDITSVDTSAAGRYIATGNVKGYTISCTAPETMVTVMAKSGDATIATHSLTWISDTSDGTSLTLRPGSNSTTRAAFQIEFSKGGDEDIPAGQIEIRVPLHIFYGRDGKAVDTVSVPLAKAPEKSGDTGFNYTIDEETNEVVITNYRAIEASYHFKCQIGYDFLPYQVANGYTKNDIQADFKIKNSTEEINEKSEELSAEVQTYVNSPNVAKNVSEKYEYWQDSWGERPDDAENYFYVIWMATSSFYRFASQPFTITYKENTGDGTLIGWKTSTDRRYTIGTQEDFEKKIFFDSGTTSQAGFTNFDDLYLIVKYPRTLISDDTTVVTNTITMKVNGYDGDIKEVNSTQKYTYVSPDLSYPGDLCQVIKYSADTVNGGINKLENGQSVEGNEFRIRIESRGYSATEDGTKPYTTVLEDNLLTLGDYSTRLNAEDYSFASFFVRNFNEYNYKIDSENGYTEVLNTEYSSYHPVMVQVKTTDNQDNWTDVGEITCTSYNNFYWKGVDGSEHILDYKNVVNLPANTYDVRFMHTGTCYSLKFEVSLIPELHPTENVLNLVKDKSYITLYNIDTGYTMNQDGNIFSNPINNSYTDSQLKQLVEQSDKENYGQLVSHAMARGQYSRLNPGYVCEKLASTPTSDVTNSQEKVHYCLRNYEYVAFSSAIMSEQEIFDLHVINEQREGVFYELLPLGMEIDYDSIVAKTESRYGGVQKECNYTVETIENWRDSSRTMVKIHVKVPEEIINSFIEYGNLVSGLRVEFDGINTWINIQDYGNKVVNSFAYYSLDGELAKGEADTGGSITDKELFYDLDEDGNPQDAVKNVHYAQNTTTFNPLTAAELGFRKYVKAADEQNYGISSEVAAGGTYTYQLRFTNGKNVKTNNVVMFDVLESAYENNTYWKGTLKSVNTTPAKNKGIAPVVYYSTYQSFTNLTVDSSQADLSDSTIWSTTPPENMEDVTAIAIDLRYKADGSDYVFESEESALCYVTMKAPGNYEEYVDNPKTDVDETIYAYNSAYLQGTSKMSDTGTESTSIEECSPVKVSLRAPDVEIHKTSNPTSGTQEKPTSVEFGSSITYHLTITNNGKAEAIYSIKVEDEIPNGLSIQKDELQYCFGSTISNPSNIKDATRVSVTANGQKLEFSVDKLDAGETIHLLIPVTVTEVGKVYQNTAKLVEFNEKTWKIESETTWHKTTESFELPNTGGIGDFTVYFAGLTIIFSSVFGMAIKRKRKC